MENYKISNKEMETDTIQKDEIGQNNQNSNESFELEDDSNFKGERGNILLLFIFPLMGFVAMFVLGYGFVSVFAISFILAIYYLIATKELSSGKTVKKYDEETRSRAFECFLMILVLIFIYFVF